MADVYAPSAEVEFGDHAETREDHMLASNALGLPQVLFCIVTGAAPIAAMLFNVPVSVSGGGWASPSAFLVATIVLTVFSVGYIEMSRRVTAAGGFYSFITHAFGPVMGMGTAALISLCYVVFCAAVIGVTSYFASVSFQDWFGVNVPAWLIMAAIVAITAALSWFHIELTAKILGFFLVTELIGLLVFGFAILFQGGDSGIHLAPLNPLNLSDNSGAVKAFGAAALGVALFGAFWSWVGFEMAPNYAEESRNPRKIGAQAMYASVIGLGVLYVFISWMFVSGWGQGNAAQAVADQFAGKYGSAFYPLTDRYVGAGLTTVFEILIITGSFACQLAFYNTASRYFYAMGREGLIPAALGRTHRKHHSPYIASMVVTAMVSVYIIGFLIYDSSTEAALLKLGTYSPLLGVLGILFVQAVCSVAVIRFFLTEARDGFHWFKTLVAPGLGTLFMVGACYLLIANRASLAGAGDAPFIKLLPYVAIAMFLIGIVAAFYFRAVDTERYESIGRFALDDELSHDPVLSPEFAPIRT
jgi:amino acid transporter